LLDIVGTPSGAILAEPRWSDVEPVVERAMTVEMRRKGGLEAIKKAGPISQASPDFTEVCPPGYSSESSLVHEDFPILRGSQQ
jgi:hypothetical protein